MDGLSGNAGGRASAAAEIGGSRRDRSRNALARLSRPVGRRPLDAEGLYRPPDVLQRKTAEILEARLYPARYRVPHVARNHDAPGRRRALEPNGDVHAIAVQLAVVDNEVAEVEADAEHDGGIGRLIAIGVEHCLLDPDGGTQRLDRTGEFDHRAVAGQLDQPAPAMPDDGLDVLGTMRLQAKMRAAFIDAHQAHVTHDVDHHDRRQPPYHLLCAHGASRGRLNEARDLAQRRALERFKDFAAPPQSACASRASQARCGPIGTRRKSCHQNATG